MAILESLEKGPPDDMQGADQVLTEVENTHQNWMIIRDA